MKLFSICIGVVSACTEYTEVFWKGGQVSTDKLRSANSRKLKVGLLDSQDGWYFRDASQPTYHPHFSVFILFSRQRCGIDFIRGWDDGRLSFDVQDEYQEYGSKQFIALTEMVHFCAIL